MSEPYVDVDGTPRLGLYDQTCVRGLISGIFGLGLESGATLQELHQACDAVARTLEAEVAARMAAKAGADVAGAGDGGGEPEPPALTLVE